MARAIRALATAMKRAMETVAGTMATAMKRAMTKPARAMVMETRVVGD
jgi:hypothetical protein